MRDACDIDFFNKSCFDIGICTGWQRLIDEAILNTFSHGVFGWHGSGFEFPNGRGRSPLNWSVRLGLNKIYHNCFKYNSGADQGAIFETRVFSIEETDYISDVIKKASEHIKDSTISLKDAMNNQICLLDQPNMPRYLFRSSPKRWALPKTHSVETAINITRSCSNPFPGAYIESDIEKFRIWKLKKCIDNLLMDPSKDWIVKNDKLFISFNDGIAYSDHFELVSNK